MELSEYTTFAERLAKQAGDVMRKYYKDAKLHTQYKTDDSPVTVADTMINQLIIDEVQQHYPDHGVLGEEASTVTTAHSHVWVCDPIDGTDSFALGIPTATFSLALVVNGDPVIGVIYDPIQDQLFSAVKGKAATRNGVQLDMFKQPEELGQETIAVTGSVKSIIDQPDYYRELLERGYRLTTFIGGVFKATLIAEGSVSGYVCNGATHDVAAAKVIVESLGGVVGPIHSESVSYATQQYGYVLAANRQRFEELRQIARKYEQVRTT